MELLTHSRMDSFKTCRRKHWFSYELGIRKTTDAKALRMGSAHHAAIELLGMGQSLEAAVSEIYRAYEHCPDQVPVEEWNYERETLIQLACGYQWRWQNDGLIYHATEQSFRFPLLNPATSAASKKFEEAGKIDGIVQFTNDSDGRLMVKESKLLGDDIGPDSDLWRRLRIDSQISLYVRAARRLGYSVDAVLYDVTRKPTIKPTPVPCVDDEGVKIVVDAAAQRVKTAKGAWRQTASTADGYVLLTRPMTTEEWGRKLILDITERPDFYFARIEVTRLDQDVEEYAAEVWEIQKTLREAQRENRWFRTVNRNTCDFCAYFGICTNGWKPGDPVPEGFEKVTNVHPELGDPDEHVTPESPASSSCTASRESERTGERPREQAHF
jgi:CRISPR/Cas system-associated exonuclease Cas4 (RecB family)